ncbi:cofactor-independent phosphoglycerate mutase [Methanoregula sp.]|uniref:cofactor-independent phosphoglycerate mutase n=1 Tax=Methanoregula sp. TaxID=2052170 RepID=UPI0023717DB3|nr:cofactor-independent phosphoglycerate mutase [Methanoregula sp.]MDD1686606.1 cofactor-independent phosphoglycerate mutase [Methanoregula sp.]
MKYIIVLGDGMADEPIASLEGKTPLEYAKTPNLDRMAREGACGRLRTVPDGFEAGSDIANMSVLGYAPEKYYTGRGPLEALSMGIDLSPGDVAYRCNLVDVENETMADFSAGHISSGEGKDLFAALQPAIPEVMVQAGVSYRNLLVVHGGHGSTSTPPHDIVGQGIAGYLPKGKDAELLLRCMEKSRSVFAHHPVNKARAAAGKRPATQIWPWSGGKKPAFPLFADKYGKKGGMISAVDLLNGIARCAGMEVITVPGATGYLDTDYAAKARYALDAIKRLDFVYVHIEAPDEAGHMGSIEEKVKAIEKVDEVVGTILNGFDGVVAVLPDHPTPIRAKTHTRDPVPFVVRGKGTDNTQVFSEKAARTGGLGMKNAVDFLDFLFS